MRVARNLLLATLLLAGALLLTRTGGAAPPVPQEGRSGGIEILADTQESEGGFSRARGAVEVRIGGIVITADEADYDESTGELEARGEVRYRNLNGKEDLRATRIAYNARTGSGTFYDVSGTVSSATQAAARILTTDNPFYIEGAVVHKANQTFIVHDGMVTNCDPQSKWWSMRSPRTTIEPGRSATIRNGLFRLKGFPIFYFPIFKKSLERVPRRSGLLTPNVGNSSLFGFMLGQSYFWAINRSYDATLNGTWFAERGIATQSSFRGRPTENSSFDAAFFGVADRGRPLPDGSRQKEGGGQFMLKGMAALPAGFRGVADVTVLSSLVFRQAFTQTFEEAATSQVRSIGFVTRNVSSYSINSALWRDENFQSREPGDTVVITKLPSVEFNSRDRQVLGGPAPVYFGFDTSFDLVSRSQPAFQTRNFVQRGDLYPRVSTALHWKGFHVTPTLGARYTGYGQQREDSRITGSNLHRTAGEFSLDVAPPSLHRVFNGPKWLGDKLKHVIEPRLRYRYVAGVDDFDTVVRFDDRDIFNNTNEAEISLVQRLFAKDAESGQTREIASVEIWQRRYFEPEFGGAIAPGRRNVLRSSLDLTPFAFIDQARNYSPVVFALKTRPSWNASLEWRTDLDPLRNKMTNSALTFDYRITPLIRASVGHNAVRVPTTISPATNQLTTLIGVGDFNRRGWNFAVNSIYDYRDQVFIYTGSQVSYNTDCCGFGFEFRRFSGIRAVPENQFRVSLSIANVGSFGTLRPRERLF